MAGLPVGLCMDRRIKFDDDKEDGESAGFSTILGHRRTWFDDPCTDTDRLHRPWSWVVPTKHMRRWW